MFCVSVSGRCAVKDPHHQDQSMMWCALVWQVLERPACSHGSVVRAVTVSCPQQVCAHNIKIIISTSILMCICRATPFSHLLLLVKRHAFLVWTHRYIIKQYSGNWSLLLGWSMFSICLSVSQLLCQRHLGGSKQSILSFFLLLM